MATHKKGGMKKGMNHGVPGFRSTVHEDMYGGFTEHKVLYGNGREKRRASSGMRCKAPIDFVLERWFVWGDRK